MTDEDDEYESADLSDAKHYLKTTKANYGPAHKVYCYNCLNISLVQVSNDSPVEFCPVCGKGKETDSGLAI